MSEFRLAKQNFINFGASAIVSRAATFILIPLFTFSLSVVNYGKYELMLALNAFLVPLFSLMTHEILLKKCLASENKSESSAVLTNAFVFIVVAFPVQFFVIGFLVSLDIFPANSLFYGAIAAFLITIYELLGKFCKGSNNNFKYLMGNIVLAGSLLVFNIFFLLVLKWGLTGAILSYLLSYVVAVVYLFVSAKIFKNIDTSYVDFGIIISLLRQSLPLVPNALLWWGINLSDRFILIYYDGSLDLGYYAFASKISSIILVIQSVLFQVWQLIVYRSHETRYILGPYFSFYAQTMIFFAAFLIICFGSFLNLFIAEEFQEAIDYSFYIMLAMVFFSLASALGVFYVIGNDTIGALKTTLVATIINIILNFISIPKFGISGAIFATIISTVLLFSIRFLRHKNLLVDVFSFRNILALLLFGLIMYWVIHGTELLLVISTFVILTGLWFGSLISIRRLI